MIDDHKPVTAFDVSDDNPEVIARKLDMLTREVRSGFEMLGQRILTAIDRMEESISDLKQRVGSLERSRDTTEQRLAALERKT